jgi:hypothetical protein
VSLRRKVTQFCIDIMTLITDSNAANKTYFHCLFQYCPSSLHLSFTTLFRSCWNIRSTYNFPAFNMAECKANVFWNASHPQNVSCVTNCVYRPCAVNVVCYKQLVIRVCRRGALFQGRHTIESLAFPFRMNKVPVLTLSQETWLVCQVSVPFLCGTTQHEKKSLLPRPSHNN